ncbi:MAG: tetratricopeptide repeat protein [Sedimentisphaerales bacterium]|nr:tetratricopeptide repeat protein [Sedimentisphaerales bacterium]
MAMRTDFPVITDRYVPTWRIDAIIEGVLIGLLAFMPLALGVVSAWSEQVVIAAAAILALCLALRHLLYREARIVWTWAYVPLILFVALAAMQLVPLPAAAVRAVSPHTAETRTGLLGTLSNPGDVSDSMTLSFYPLATEHDLRLVLSVAVIFIVVVNVYRRPEQIKRLLAAVTIIAGGIALLALAQTLTASTKIYWTIPTYGTANAGPFVNHSHFAQFMNLSIGIALGLLLVKLLEGFWHQRIELTGVVARLGEPVMRPIWLCLGIIVLGMATIFISLSRGGMIALLIAGAFTSVIITFKRGLRGRSWIITAMTLGSFLCVLYIGFDAVYDRLATLREFHRAQSGRWGIVKDISIAWTRFPLLGTGLGTHDVVYPMFDRSSIASLASHAENEYAQAAEETGGLGLALILVFVAIVWHAFYRSIRHIRLPVRAAAAGLGFGLLAIMIQSLSDFGQHLPANACLTAVTCGLLVTLAKMNPGWAAAVRDNPGRPLLGRPSVSGSRSRRWLGGLVLLVVLTGPFGWALFGVDRARRAETSWQKALLLEHSLQDKQWLGDNDEYTAILADAAAAVAHQPKSVEYRYWLNVYRWRAISRVSDPNTGNIIMTPESIEYTRRIVEELQRTYRRCPTYGPAYCLAGQLEYFILDDPSGADQIRSGYRLAPCDPTVCVTTALLDIEQGEPDRCLAKLARAVELDGRFFEDAADILIHQADRPDLAVHLAGQNVHRLSRVSTMLGESAEHAELVEKARADVARLLREKCAEAGAPAEAHASLGYLYLRQKDYQAAADCFQRAVTLDYEQVHWHLTLARTLAQLDRIPEAIHEARICLRLRPPMAAARKLIEELSVRTPAETTTNKE